MAECAFCGGAFDITRTRSLCCNRSCAAKYAWRGPKKLSPVACGSCGKVIERNTPQQRYCTERCRLKEANKRYIAQRPHRIRRSKYMRMWRERKKDERRVKRHELRSKLKEMFNHAH